MMYMCVCVRARAPKRINKCMTECVGTNDAAQWSLAVEKLLYADTIKRERELFVESENKERCNIVCVALYCAVFLFSGCFEFAAAAAFVVVISFSFVDSNIGCCNNLNCNLFSFRLLLARSSVLGDLKLLFLSRSLLLSNKSQKATASKYRK